MDSREKLQILREQAIPVMLAALEDLPMGKILAKFMEPQIEGFCDRELDGRTVEELDVLLERAVGVIAALRSDGRYDLAVVGGVAFAAHEVPRPELRDGD